MRKYGNKLTRYSKEERYSLKQAVFRPFRDHLGNPDNIDPSIEFPSKRLIPDLLSRLDAIEQYQSQLFVISRSFRDSAFQLRFHQTYTDANNYVFYKTVVWNSWIFLYQKITVVAGNATYKYTSNYPIEKFIDGKIEEPIEANYTVGASPYPDKIVGLDNILVVYPSYQFYPRDMPSTMEDFWKLLAEINDIYYPNKVDFASLAQTDPMESFGDLSKSQEYWNSGYFDTQYIFNIGHIVPMFLMIDRNLTKYACEKFGPGLLVCRMSDEAIDRSNQVIIRNTVENHVIIIPDYLGFERTDYPPIYTDIWQSSGLLTGVIQELRLHIHPLDIIWWYSIDNDKFVRVGGGTVTINEFTDIQKFANNWKNQTPSNVYQMTIVTYALISVMAIRAFNQILKSLLKPRLSYDAIQEVYRLGSGTGFSMGDVVLGAYVDGTPYIPMDVI